MKQSSELIIILVLLASYSAHAFDRIICEGNLGSWSVHNGTNYRDVILNRAQTSVYLARDQSLFLLLRTNKAQEIASLSPWNVIQFFKAKDAVKQGYIFDFKTDKKNWFTLSVQEPKTSTNHTFSCKMSF